MTSQDDRERRADDRRQRREEAANEAEVPTAGEGQDSAPDEGGAEADGVRSSGDEGSPLRTGATLAAAGALVGVAVGAASAVRSRQSGGGAEPEADAPADSLEETGAGGEPRATAEPEPQREEPDADADHAEAEDGGDLDHGDDGGGAPRGVGGEGGDESDDEERAEARAEPESGSAASIVRQAREQLPELTGRECEGVLGFERTENGWLVQVELVELKRIPWTTDVLGVYDVELDDDGTVQNYHRTNRYVRSQGGGGA